MHVAESGQLVDGKCLISTCNCACMIRSNRLPGPSFQKLCLIIYGYLQLDMGVDTDATWCGFASASFQDSIILYVYPSEAYVWTPQTASIYFFQVKQYTVSDQKWVPTFIFPIDFNVKRYFFQLSIKNYYFKTVFSSILKKYWNLFILHKNQ